MKRNMALLFFVLAKFVFDYALVGADYGLHRDEFLHLDQANHLAFGYLSVPPFTSWIAFLVRILGNGEFWVKFFPCLFGALTLVVVWKAIAALGGNWFALILGAFSVLFSALMRLNMLFQPNSFEVLAWTFIAFTFIKYQKDKNPRWFIVGGIALGFGFLNKYNILFFALAFFVGLLVSGQRKILLEKKLWIGLAIAFTIVLPNLVWQMCNGFPVIHHMELLEETQLVNVSAGDFMKEQVLFFFGSIPVLVAGLAGLAFVRQLHGYRFFLWFFFLCLGLFISLHAKGYYAISLYPIFLAFGAVVLEQRLQSKPGIVLRGICVALPVGFFVLILPLAFPKDAPEIISMRVRQNPGLHLSRWEDGKNHDLPQDFADMLGWKELASKVGSAMDALPKHEYTIILCDNYGQAGAINYYLKTNKAVTMNADYVRWFDLSKPIVNIVLVQEASDDDPERKRERAFFGSVAKVGEIEDPYAREKGTSIYVLRKAKTDVNAILESEIEKEIQRWR